MSYEEIPPSEVEYYWIEESEKSAQDLIDEAAAEEAIRFFNTISDKEVEL